MEIRINRDDKSDSVGCSSLFIWLNELMIENISSLHGGQHNISGPTNFDTHLAVSLIQWPT